MFFWVGVHIYVCFGLECLCDIRLERLYAKRLVILALCIVITPIYINKIHHTCRPSQMKECGGLGFHERERGLRD
jgi:hypothetical protein